MEGAFINKEFIQQEGLTLENIIHPYFESSPYYKPERGSKLEISFAQPHGSAVLSAAHLSKPEHKSVSVDQGLVVIDEVLNNEIIAKYIVKDGYILPAPTFYNLIAGRVCSSLNSLQKSIKNVHKVFNWNVKRGFTKRIAYGETETKYEFRASELKDLRSESGDEFRLQSTLLDALLTEIGIPSA
ncbi:hypothetical protein TVAG_105740 [Trichomonas vaginalis G3]|uniref:Mediator of RNA polymerase II transcription subunit 6 n=1 Tax=Trichomonas vaginalis (strain ATCC PRA-98 / G3) TaxID=412133 RepID=A2FLR3_TRIV3|nr:Mediator complex, subunit Med6 family [Trichomonas vaginalis G3]EAX94155.1 hypothetical protein TVAG_105740 [Trichomonas vaginalis G3]KAI5518078.1 Mediator complex, subunit Med6 family [Trichomonas vaginalis G3]|eukprot:XP_001307085.1 hypothetical protein [Trichomonas vaginalis G3]